MPLSEPPNTLDNLYKLLPSNATKLEQDLLKITPFDAILQPIALLMRGIGDTIFPEDWKLWIIQQRGQLPLLEAIGNTDLLLEHSIYLLDHHGTLAAVERVCFMLGFPYAAVWEQEEPSIQFAEFHVDLGKSVGTQTMLERLEKAIKFVKPLRSRLRRMYSNVNYDVRRLVIDKRNGKQNGILDRQIYDHFSGYQSKHNPALWINFPVLTEQEYDVTGGLEIEMIQFDSISIYGYLQDSNGEYILDSLGRKIVTVSPGGMPSPSGPVIPANAVLTPGGETITNPDGTEIIVFA